jgi:hypothetical protein
VESASKNLRKAGLPKREEPWSSGGVASTRAEIDERTDSKLGTMGYWVAICVSKRTVESFLSVQDSERENMNDKSRI